MSLSAAEVLSSEVFNGWKALTGLEIVEGLGSTEVLHIYLCNRPDKKKPGAAGLRVPGYEILLRDKDGREVGSEEGIMWVRGDSATPLYWNRPDKSAETIREGGWIYTGDRFVRDADGFTSSAAAPTISSRFPANGSIRSRSSCASPNIPRSANAPSTPPSCRTAA